MQRNLSLPHINLSSSNNNNIHNTKQTSLYQSPNTYQKKQNGGIKSLSQLDSSLNDSKSNLSYYSPQKSQRQHMKSDSKLPSIQQKSVQEMQQQIQYQDQKLQQQIKREQDEITTILLEDNQLIIQPKFFEKKGSMCTTELWSGSLKKEFLVFSQQDVDTSTNGKRKLKVKRIPKNNRKGSMPEVEKLLANIYRPDKLKNQAEVNRILEDLKQGVQITKQSIEQQIKNYENRTPLDIKVRILQKKKTMVFDESAPEEDGIEENDVTYQQKTESDELSSSQKQLSLPPQLAKNDSLYKVEQFGIQEVEDERLESSPINGQYQNYPQYYSDAIDSIKYSEGNNKQDSIGSFDNEEDSKIDNESKFKQHGGLNPSRREKGQFINIHPVNENENSNGKSKYYQKESQNKRNASMPRLLNSSTTRMKKALFDKVESQSKYGNNTGQQFRKNSDRDIPSLNNIPQIAHDNSFSDYEDEVLTGRETNDNNHTNNFSQANYEAILNSSKNPELNSYVNCIRNVIEECNQSLEQNTVLTKQIKKHTYKLNNRSKNFNSVANLEKRIQSSTVF